MRNKFQTQALKELGSVKGVQALSLEEMKLVNGGGSVPVRHVGNGVYQTKDGYYYYTGGNGLIYFGVAISNATRYISNYFS